MKKYFGTDGIRGKAYEVLTEDLAYRVGLALKVLNNDYLVLGRDTRESGIMLRDGIKKGAEASGIMVIDVGIVSTPLLAYLSGRFQALGVMITASHNPYQDNGIKVFKAGKKLFLREEEQIESVLHNPSEVEMKEINVPELPFFDPFELYFEIYQDLLVKTSLKIGLDLANGATYEIAKNIFSKIASCLETIGDNPDGKNINKNVGSTHLEALTNLVLSKNLDIGFAFDGDGDRLMVVGKDGKVYDGDLLLYVFATYLKEKNLLKENTLVLTKMSNLGIVKALKKKGIEVLLTDVGDKYVLEALETKGLSLGGENSGHIINLNLLNTGDGVLNAIFLIKILEESQKSIEELTAKVWMYPDRTYNLKNVDKSLAYDYAVLSKVEEYRDLLGNDGKILVRPSGTEPVIRITVSAPSQAEVDAIVEEIVKVIMEQRFKGG